MKTSLLSVTILILIISGCKKEANSDGHVQTMTNSGLVTRFTYDNQGRLIFASNATGTTTIVYSQGKVTKTTTSGGTFTTIYTLDSMGHAIYDDAGASYAYDSNGYLTSVIKNNGSSSDTTGFTISNGNVTGIIFNGHSIYPILCTYTGTVDSRDYGIYFLGKNSNYFGGNIGTGKTRNLLNSAFENPITLEYSYVFDQEKRVSSQIIAGPTLDTTTYTY